MAALGRPRGRCDAAGATTNSGGPHCLADGVTSAHIHAIEVVLPDGSITVLGGVEPEPDGIVPAAVEMMDQVCLQAVEEFIHAGLPVDQAAALLIEVVGLPAGVAAQIDRIRELAELRDVGTIRLAADDADRALLWKGRKSAFGAIARIKPNYYLHDTVVPRHKLPEVLAQVYEIAARHELLVLVDLAAQADLRRAFDPMLLSNPDKVLPSPAGCGDIHSVPEGAWV